MAGEEVKYEPTEDWEREWMEMMDPTKLHEKPEALKGIRVLDCTIYILAPTVGMTLAAMGAEVLHIEMPRVSEAMRFLGMYREPWLYPMHEEFPLGTALGYANAHDNKYFITLDYHKPEAIEIFYDLVRRSDVMIENYRPGTMGIKWPIGYRQVSEINPRLIYIWLGGYGGWGPGRERASYDYLGQVSSGIFTISGYHEDFGGFPLKQACWFLDWYGGYTGALGVMAALYWRRKTGLGTMIEYSQAHGGIRLTGHALPLYGRFGVVRQRWGNWDTLLCVHGAIKCGKSSYPDSKNPQLAEAGYIFISAWTDEDWERLCKVIGKPELYEKYKRLNDRVKPEAQMEIYAALEEWAKDKTKEDVQRILDDNKIVNMPIYNVMEYCEHSMTKTRRAVFWLEDPTYGEVLFHHTGWFMSETPPRVRWIWRPLGADNVMMYKKVLGLSIEKIKELYDKKVI